MIDPKPSVEQQVENRDEWTRLMTYARCDLDADERMALLWPALNRRPRVVGRRNSAGARALRQRQTYLHRSALEKASAAIGWPWVRKRYKARTKT